MIIGPGSGVAEASSPPYCWLGYCGNDSIYMTTGACRQFLNNITCKGGTFEKTCNQYCCPHSYVDSSMAMALGRHNDATDKGSFCEGYRNSKGTLQVFLPVALSGFTRTTNLSYMSVCQKRFRSIWSDHISSVLVGLGTSVKDLMSICRNLKIYYANLPELEFNSTGDGSKFLKLYL